jgi:hypothetical protein
VGAPTGALLEQGRRFKADTMLRDIIASYGEDDTMTPEQQAMYDIGVRATAHAEGQVGNLQNAIHATDGWATWLESKASATRKMRNQGGHELHDAAKSMRYVLTGVEES